MKKRIYHILCVCVIVCVAFAYAGCSSSPKSQYSEDDLVDDAKTAFVQANDTFLLPDVPSELTDEIERTEFLTTYFWTYFDFNNEVLISKSKIAEQAIVNYINMLSVLSDKQIEQGLKSTLKKAEVNKKMYAHFVAIFDKYFYDRTSPFRNEERYIVVLKEALASSKLSDYDAQHRKFQWKIIHKNRLKTKASDFKYTLLSGKTRRLYTTKSEYIILMFSNPDCHTCHDAMEQIRQSDVLQDVFSRNTESRTMLTVLMMYVYDDIGAWKQYASAVPADWLYARDDEHAIKNKMLYDVHTFPTLYLLDKNKRVLLKDTSVEEIESFFTII